MALRIDHPPYRWEAARKMYVDHMRSQGHGGDDWDSLPSTTRQDWLLRAESYEIKANRRVT